MLKRGFTSILKLLQCNHCQKIFLYSCILSLWNLLTCRSLMSKVHYRKFSCLFVCFLCSLLFLLLFFLLGGIDIFVCLFSMFIIIIIFFLIFFFLFFYLFFSS